ncbi:hypothetical protein NOF04DRAFT_1331754 [Fusarium oxysporum II5]|nr:hypothetical protein NOF04DRAFT_1331754 [Fusarium oxysporum II5]
MPTLIHLCASSGMAPSPTTDVEHSDPTEIFLDSFQGLEKFYLDQAGAVVSKYTWESVYHHSSTLKRFVNHSKADRSIFCSPDL